MIWVFEVQRKNCMMNHFVLSFLSVGSISSGGRSNLGLPLVSIRQQLLLVVQQFFTSLGGVFSVRGCRHEIVSFYLYNAESTTQSGEEKAYFRQSRPLGNSPGSSHSRCTWSYQYRTESSDDSHPHAPQPRW